MKNIILFFCSWIIVNTTAIAQIQPHKADLYLKATNFSDVPIPFFKLTLKTMEGTQPQYSVTDSKGNATFKVITGNNYQVYLADTAPFATINIPLKSMSFITKKIAIPEETAEVAVTKTSIDTIDQRNLSVQRPEPGNIIFKVGLFNHLNQAIKNMDVRIYNPQTKMVYLSRTNNYGFAQFNVPGKTSYTVGIEQFEQFETVTLPHYSFALSLTYVPTKVSETEINDTIRQEPDRYMRTTTDRVLVKIHLKDHDNKALANENVYFDIVDSDKVFMGRTGSDGMLTMMLPKGHQYELNFTYERAVKILDYPMTPTLYTTQFYMTYIGTERVENFYNSAERQNGLRTEFMNPKATPVKMEPGLVEITDYGFNVNFPDEGPILTPAVVNDKLIISAGYYNPDVFCVNPENGEFIWGLKLAENGSSIMVVEDGMLLINTQSCTLYAIDLEKGMLAWSKWLGPNIYHSPMVANGKVYAVYPDALGYSADNFVLAAFDLKTGDIVWQSRLKSEPLAAPVYENNQVFITDLAGFLYHFDADKGTRKALLKANAVSMPILFDNSLWVNIRADETKAISYLARYNPDNLKEIATYPAIIDSAHSGQLRYLKASYLMSYSRSRLLANKLNYFQLNASGLESYSRANNTRNWAIPFNNKLDSKVMMAFAGKYLLFTENNAKLNLINPSNGKIMKTYKLSAPITSEPAIYNGWIYCGTENGSFIALNTKDKAITGWNQFGMNGAHNPVKN